jgi:hypothetical protein
MLLLLGTFFKDSFSIEFGHCQQSVGRVSVLTTHTIGFYNNIVRERQLNTIKANEQDQEFHRQEQTKARERTMNKNQLKGTAYHPTNQLTLVYQLHPYTCPLAGTDPRLHLHSRLVHSQIQILSAWGGWFQKEGKRKRGHESAEVHFPKQMSCQKKKETVLCKKGFIATPGISSRIGLNKESILGLAFLTSPPKATNGMRSPIRMLASLFLLFCSAC